MSELLLDRAGRRRSPATMPGFHAGRPPHNKGLRYPADPPKVEEIIAVMRTAGDRPHGRRLRALIVLLWRAGLRIHEALALTEGDLDQRRSSCGPSSRSVPCCASSTARRSNHRLRAVRQCAACGFCHSRQGRYGNFPDRDFLDASEACINATAFPGANRSTLFLSCRIRCQSRLREMRLLKFLQFFFDCSNLLQHARRGGSGMEP